MTLRSTHRSLSLPPWLVGLLVVLLPWGALSWGDAKRTMSGGLLEVGFPLLLAVVAVWSLLRAAQRAELPPEFRSALRWVAVGCILVGLGTTYVLIHDVLLKRNVDHATLGFPDLTAMLSYPVIMLGQFRFSRAGRSTMNLGRIVADSAIFICGVAVPLWTLALKPNLSQLQAMERFIALTFPLLAFLGIIVVNFVILRCVPIPSRRAFNLLQAGIAMSWLADLVFTLSVTGHMQLHSIGHIANILNALSLLALVLAGWWIQTDSYSARPLRPSAFSPIPIFTIGIMALWLGRYLQVFEVTKGTLQNILLGVIAILVVILLREALAARDSLHLATETAALAMKARFEALVEQSRDLIMVTDATGRLLSTSPAAVRFFGRTEPELQGLPLAGLIHAEDLEAWDGFLAELLHRSEFRTTQQWRMQDAQGEWRAFDISGTNLLDNHDVEGLVLNARAITDRGLLEDQQHQALKMEALGRLAGVIAHDFNNLLSAILGNVELALMNPSDGVKLTNRLERIQATATHGANLTARLASFTRRNSSTQTSLSARKVLEELLPLSRGLLGEAIQLQVSEEPETGSFRANLDDLEQVLVSLLANARDAMPEGGSVSVSFRNADTLDGDQTLFLAPGPAPYILVEVADTGTGMDEHVLAHLFEPFFTTKGKATGTGLELTRVYGIVKASGGGIGVRTEPGQGTTFRLWFPQVVAGVEEASIPHAVTTIQGTETLLLVEDEEVLREALEEILRSLGYQVFVAAHANEARAFLADYTGSLDLLVTDVIMPGDSGPKLAAELVKARPGLRVLYISGYTADELEAHGLAHPGALLLEKPFTRKQIGQRLREVLA